MNAPREPMRQCTCHPDDNPPVPCPKKYALTDCRMADPERTLAEMRADNAALQARVEAAERNAVVIAELRRHLKAGATIKATDVNGTILEWKENNTMYGGLTLDFPGASVTWEGRGYNSIQVEEIFSAKEQPR